MTRYISFTRLGRTAAGRSLNLFLALIFLQVATPACASTPAPETTQADPDAIARADLESARADLKAGRATRAMRKLSAVFALPGVSEIYRAKSMAITVDLSLRRGDWKMARRCAERVVDSTGADATDRAFCQDVLRTLRQDHPEVFP